VGTADVAGDIAVEATPEEDPPIDTETTTE
jgi:hypothetical protein